jgi:hypothetical protein
VLEDEKANLERLVSCLLKKEWRPCVRSSVDRDVARQNYPAVAWQLGDLFALSAWLFSRFGPLHPASASPSWLTESLAIALRSVCRE